MMSWQETHQSWLSDITLPGLFKAPFPIVFLCSVLPVQALLDLLSILDIEALLNHLGIEDRLDFQTTPMK